MKLRKFRLRRRFSSQIVNKINAITPTVIALGLTAIDYLMQYTVLNIESKLDFYLVYRLLTLNTQLYILIVGYRLLRLHIRYLKCLRILNKKEIK
jgi:hypothetical protein